MDSNNLTVAGRKFRTHAEYEAALRDEHKIKEIKVKFDLDKKADVFQLYQELQTGSFSFETPVGNDFDDEIFDLVEQFKAGTIKEKSTKAAKDKKKKREQKTKAAKNVSLDSFDRDMQKEIMAVLKKKERRRKGIVIGCSILAIASFTYFGIYYFFAGRTDADIQNLARLKNSKTFAGTPQESVMVHKTGDVELPDILEEYKTPYIKNKRLIGWLKIDDTKIDYPVMQTSNNEYYLDHNFNQEYDKNGSIFMDYECSVYPRSTNLIVYGHHMKSGKMFGQLQNYAKESYFKDHSVIQFDTIYEKGTYAVMYAFRSRIYNENEIVFKYYQFIDANSEEEFNSHMNEMANLSLYDTGVTASYGDQLLTLSTCDNSQTDGRFVVVAKRIS